MAYRHIQAHRPARTLSRLKIDDTISTLIYFLDISDNPDIIFDASDICAAYANKVYYLIYDKSQEIRNCEYIELD